MAKRDSFLTNYASVVSAQAISTIANFILVVIVSRHYGVEQFGLFTYIFALSELLYFLAEFGFPSVIVSEAPHFRYSADFYAPAFQIQMLFAIVALVCIVLMQTFMIPNVEQRIMGAGVAVYLIAQAPSRTLRSVFRSFERARYEAFTTLAEKAAALAIAGSAAVLNWRLVFLAVGLGCIGGINVVVLVILCRSYFVNVTKLTWSAPVTRAVLAACVPLGISSLFTIVNYRIGTLFLERMYGNVEVGLFGAAQRLVTPLAYVASTLQAVLLPFCARRVAVDRAAIRTLITSCLRWVVIAGIALFLLTQFMSARLLTIVFGSSYLGALPAFRALMISVPLTFAIPVSGIALLLMRRYRSLTIAWAASSVLSVSANWVLVRSHQAVGVSYSTILSELLLLLAVLWMGRDFVGNQEAIVIAGSSLVIAASAVFMSPAWNVGTLVLLSLLLLPRKQRQIVRYLRTREDSPVPSLGPLEVQTEVQ